MKINKQDVNGVKPLLAVGELGYDNYPSGGDIGRIYVGTGSSNIALAKKSEVDAKVVANANITAGTATKVTYDAKGLVTSGTTLSAGDIPVLDAGKITTGILSVVRGGTGVATSTGSGDNVLSASPTLTTPNIGVASGTSFNSITGLASVAPVVAGTAAVGTSTLTARQDHVHPAQTTISGNAGTATTLATGRTIGMTGDVTWTSASFNGAGNVTGVSTLATITDSGTGSFKKVTTNTKGLVTGTQAVSQADITGLLGTGSITNTMLANTAVTNLSGTNTGDQIITLTGDVTGYGTGSFVTTLANSGVTAGTYSKMTVDAKGRVTAGFTQTMEDIPDATFKRSVRAATTANITLSAPQTIDGISVVAGDRVLVKDQTTAFQNGIYVVAAGAWTRALDADTASKIASALVAVDSGTVNGGKLFDNDFKTTDTLGTTAMLWAFNLDSGSLSSTTPLVAGTAAIGTGTTVARADHVHPAQATITGNAGTATTLQTARTISGVSFNGSANIEIEDRLGTAIASAATITIGTRGLGDYIHITGVATITSLGTAAAAGIRRTLIFDGALTLTHNATSLICPGAANIVTVSGTVIEVVSETTANWRVVSITHPSLGMLELGYLDGVTSAIQAQINLKAPLGNPVFTGAISTQDVNYKSTPISVTSWSYVTTTITLNVASHTFVAGDYIEVLGLTSTTHPANGIHLVTSVTSTTIVFTLGATPTGTAGVSSATVKGITTLNGKIISEDIGINQSWQLVTRLSNTNYSNTSNRMIKMVVYGAASSVEGQINAIITPIGSTTAITMPMVITTPNGECIFNFSIPAGCTYKIEPVVGTLDVLVWYEFR